jgi:hypothetical protein
MRTPQATSGYQLEGDSAENGAVILYSASSIFLGNSGATKRAKQWMKVPQHTFLVLNVSCVSPSLVYS